MRGRPSSNPLTVSPVHRSTCSSRGRSGFSRVESRSRTIWCRIVSNPRTVSPDPSREEAPAVTTVAATWRHQGHCWQKQKSKRKWRRLVPICWFWTTLILWATKLWRNLHSLSPCERFLFIFKFSKNADFPKKNTKSPKPFSWCWRDQELAEKQITEQNNLYSCPVDVLRFPILSTDRRMFPDRIGEVGNDRVWCEWWGAGIPLGANLFPEICYFNPSRNWRLKLRT